VADIGGKAGYYMKSKMDDNLPIGKLTIIDNFLPFII